MTIALYNHIFGEQKQAELRQSVEAIRTSPNLQRLTEQYRLLLHSEDPHAKEEADKLKRSAPALMPAVHTRDKRRTEEVTQVTGLVLCDFDHIPSGRIAHCRRLIQADPHTVVAYLTLSGEGLRVLARFIPSEEDSVAQLLQLYSRYFVKINHYYSTLIGHPYDEKCCDPVRLSFAAFDPEAYYQPEALPFTLDDAPAPADAPSAAAPGYATPREERKAYNAAKLRIERAYAKFIFPLLQKEGAEFVPGLHNDYVMRTGYLLNQCGFELPHALKWCVEKFGGEYPGTAGVVNSCYRRTEEFGARREEVKDLIEGKKSLSGGMRHASLGKVEAFLEEHVKVRQNELTGQAEIKALDPADLGVEQAFDNPYDYHPFNEEYANTLRSFMERRMELEVRRKDILCAIHNLYTQRHNPMRDFLNSLPAWHEGDKDYLAELADTVCVTEDYPHAQELFAHLLKKFMVAMVRGWIDKEVVNESMLIFIGKQGTYKSTWMRMLLPPQLRGYCCVKQFEDADMREATLEPSRNLLILHEEFSVLSPSANDNLKARLTATTSTVREVFTPKAQTRYNIASTCATSNHKQILPDCTGSRRMWPFEVNVKESPRQRPFNYEGIYSQAYALAQSDFRYWLEREEQAEVELHNVQFAAIDETEGYITTLFRVPEEGETSRFMTLAEIIVYIKEQTRFAKINTISLGRILTKKGFKKTKRGHDKVTGYLMQTCNWDDNIRRQQALALESAD